MTPAAVLALLRPGSIRARLVAGIAIVHIVLMTTFIADLTSRQQGFLKQEGVSRAFGLARMTAVSSISWVLAEDVQGLSEVMEGVRSYPDVLYAMVVDRDLRILGHTDDSRIDQRLADPVSRRLLDGGTADLILVDDDTTLDVAVPILLEGTLIGWSRLGLDRRHQEAQMRTTVIQGVAYVVLAAVLGTLFAIWVARRLTAELRHLGHEADRLRQGARALTPLTGPTDELAGLERNFVAMARTIWVREDDLARERDHLEDKVAERTRELVAAKERTETALATREQALKEQRNFLSMVSHEFRTPLGIIAGSASILSEFDATPDETRAQADKIHNAVARLERMVETLLINDWLETSEAGAGWEEFDLGPMIGSVIEEFREVEPERPFPLRLAGDLRLAGKQRLIRVALVNLIGNACKYSAAATPVEVAIAADADAIHLAVSDQGMGIRPADLARIFEKYYRANAAERKPGTGIGLHLVKQIVTVHGGHVDVASTEGKGATFTIWLPRNVVK